ncbi:MAG TPA: Na+/H+ antiporter subunit E [Burkholderiaceae bacterium]|nr:Na+/H+ antiporter subunit E [Burkholderiaceae bacterium]
MRLLLVRTLAFLLLWVLLMGGLDQLAFGAATAALAAWCSLRLRADEPLGLRPLGVVAMVPRFLWQSLVAGVDVARRAFDPRLPLNPGLVVYRPQLPPGSARSLFTGYTSLLPGTVPCGDSDGGVVYHCLDISQPIVEQLAAEEARLSRAIRIVPSRDE